MTKKQVVLDVECYIDYFMVGVRNIETGKTLSFELYDDHRFDKALLERILNNCQVFTINGNNYDIPMVYLALAGANNKMLKRASDAIIVRGLRSWQFEDQFRIRIPKIDHIDLIEVAPGQASLKIYAGRLHTQKMQDLPIEPSASINETDRINLVAYNGNDLNSTIDLRNGLLPQIALRERMTEEYGIDLRSKSDAQIAEAVIKLQLEDMTGVKPARPTVPEGTCFKYRVPSFLSYTSDTMNWVLDMVRNADFVVSDTGGIVMPEELTDAKVEIGTSVYRMGIGGLHSSESSVVHIADDDTLLIDRDVASYYPSIILGQRLFPKHLGEAFLKVYKSIVDRRLAAKRSGDKVTADSLKITINGSFGKLGSKWSALYSPDLMIQVTVTGQLALLMLIEALEEAGIPVVSANTDGVVIKCPTSRRDEMNEIVAEWERKTGFETDEAEYKALYSRDVNNYIAIKPDGKAKLKGAYAPTGLMKNPANQIAVEAAVKYLTEAVPVEDTVLACRDIRKFITVRQVNGGAIQGYSEWNPKAKVGEKTACLERAGWTLSETEKGVWISPDWTLALGREEAYKVCTEIRDAVYLGKAVRWYYGIGETRDIRYKTNGNTVSRSKGAVPVMDLPDEFPSDMDFNWYIREAFSILRDVGHPRFQYHSQLEHLI